MKAGCSIYHQAVRDQVLRYIRERRLLGAGDRICVAVSGGADSVALLRVLQELRSELGILLSVAHFNHRLRAPASDGDEEFVSNLARERELEFFAGGGDVRSYAAQEKLTLEAAARELRYSWFRQLSDSNGISAIATGHTLDDQAETVLMKFLRGAGTRGLAGVYPELLIEPRGSAENRQVLGLRVLRPLLGARRQQVESYLAGLGQTWREDESNGDSAFLRNRVRHQLLPLLERDYNPNLREVLSETAEIARGEEDYWHPLVESELRGRTHGPFSLDLTGFRDLPMALQRRILRQFVSARHVAADFVHVQKLVRCSNGEIACTELPGGWRASREGDCLTISQSSPNRVNRRSTEGYHHLLPIPGEVLVRALGRTFRAVLVSAESAGNAEAGTLLAAKGLPSELTIRNWLPGDRYHPVYRRSCEKLKRLFSEKKIPEEARPTWPVVLSGNVIIWVRGFSVASGHEWKGTGEAVRVDEIA